MRCHGRVNGPGTALAPGSDRTFAMNVHPADTVISDTASVVRTSTEGGLPAESIVGVTESVCAPLRDNGRLGVPDRWPEPVGWNTRMTTGDRSDLAGDRAEGQGILGDIRFLIVDDSTLYREYLAGVIVAHGVGIPSVAWDLPSLTTALENTKPRVLLFNMATRDNAMLLRQALTLSPSLRIIVLGLYEDDESEIVACAEAGVAGYHLRNESLGDLLVLIRKVAAGESLCSPRVSAILLRRLSALASQRQLVDKGLVLTARETQILKMLELGLSNRDIAEQLCIAVHTVKNHVHSVLTKLGVSTRAQAAALPHTIG
jgi:DNA-binding NarL/FixJ family response regulator